MAAIHNLRIVYFCDTSLFSLFFEWLPLLIATVGPLASIPFAVLRSASMTSIPKSNGRSLSGRTVLRRVLVAVRADVRFYSSKRPSPTIPA